MQLVTPSNPSTILPEQAYEILSLSRSTGKVFSVLKEGLLSIGRSYYKNSIFYALNNDNIEAEAAKFKDVSKFSIGKHGVIESGKGFVSKIVTLQTGVVSLASIPLVATAYLLNSCKPLNFYEANSSLSTGSSGIFDGASGAVSEEILFRFGIQNLCSLSQTSLKKVSPNYLQENRAFQWLTSPAARILATNALFAGIHLLNAGDYLDSLGSINQATLIILFPLYSILYETTGSIMAPIAAHVTNNIMAHTLWS